MNIEINKIMIIITVPSENINDLRNEICKEGAGIIGNYTNCSITTKCLGTFIPNDNAKPYIGEKNKLQFVEEEKLEIICDIKKVKNVIKKIKKIHPYEEPVIEIIPLIDEQYYNQFDKK